MDNNGWIVLSMGLTTLSLEIFFLKVMQLLDRAVLHTWNGYIDYIAIEGNIFLAFFISFMVIAYGLVLIIKGK